MAYGGLVIRPVGSVLAGVALFLAFPTYNVWWLAPIGVALAALSTVGAGWARGAGLGLITGGVFFLVTLSWSGAVVGPLPWIALAVAQSLFFAALGAVTGGLGQRGAEGARVRPVVVALAWVAQEAARDRIPYGGFPWARLAYSQADSPFGRLAPVVGAPGVAFAVALCGGLLAVAACHILRVGAGTARSRRGVLALAAALAVTALGAVVPLPADGPPARVLGIQGNVPEPGLSFNAERRAVLDNHVSTTLGAANDVDAGVRPRPDLVVWPENASDIDPLRNADARAVITRAVDGIGAPVLVGGLLYEPEPNISNVSLLFEPGVGLTQRYVKQHPVPFAEYVPQRDFYRMFSSAVDLVRADFVAGTQPGIFHLPAASGEPIAAGVSICFEVAYDDLIHANVAGGANLLVVQTNNATFGFSAESAQQLAISRLRAMEQSRSVVHVSTVGISALITPDGTPHQPTSLFTSAALSGELPLRTDLTLAHRLNVWPEVAACGALFLLVAHRLLRRRPAPAADAAHTPEEGHARSLS